MNISFSLVRALLSLLCIVSLSADMQAQCTGSPVGNDRGNVTPSCTATGSYTNLGPQDYLDIYVYNGISYNFNTCTSVPNWSSQINVYNGATGVTSTTAGCSSANGADLNWTANFTGYARVYVTRSGYCTSNGWFDGATSATLAYSRAAVPTPGTPSGGGTYCTSATLTRTGAPGTGVTWYWQNSSTGTSTSLGSGATYNATTSGTYYVRPLAAGSCWGTISGGTLVTIVSQHTATASGTTSICEGGTATYSASTSGGTGTTTYQWQFLSPGGSWANLTNGSSNAPCYQSVSGATTASLSLGLYDFAASCSGYKVRCVITKSGNNCGSVTSNEITTTVNDLPAPAISGSTAICSGQSTSYTASGGTSYVWSTGATSTSITVSTAGTYSVTATNASGCTASASRTLTVNALPTPSISGTNVICSGQTSTFTASGGTSYVWSTGATSTSITVSTAGTYSVTATNASGCTASASRTLTVNALPTPSISGTNVICSGQSSTFTASGGTSYVWSTGATSSSITVSTAGTYSVTATNASGCTASASRTLTVNALPTAAIAGSSSLCSGGSITYTASGGTGYVWSTGATSTSINVSTAGTYTVTVTNANGCSATASKTLTVNPLPTGSISGVSNICSGSSTTYTASGGTGYLWSTGETTPSITVSTAANYWVYVTNSYGCSAYAFKQLTVDPQPSTANAGLDIAVCNGTTASLSATAPSIGSGSWSQVGGTAVTITSPSSTTTGITGLSDGVFTFRWTVSNGVCASKTDDVQISVNSTTSYTWTGAVSSDWNNAANWDCKVPDASSHVTIPSSAPIQPIIFTGNTGECATIQIATGADLTIQTGATLNVAQ